MSKRKPQRRHRRARGKKSATSRVAPASTGHLERERIPIAEAAARLGLTVRRLQQFVAEHRDVPSIGHGKQRLFLWPELREWRDKNLIQQGVASVRPGSVEEARARKLAADADLREMEVAERRGMLMPAALFRQDFEAACARIVAHQLNAPGRYAPQLLAAFPDRLRADDLVRAEEFIRRMIQDQMAELEAGDDVPEDEEAAAG